MIATLWIVSLVIAFIAGGVCGHMIDLATPSEDEDDWEAERDYWHERDAGGKMFDDEEV